MTCLVMIRIIATVMSVKLVSSLRVMPNHRRYVEKVENNRYSNILAGILNTSIRQLERSRRINTESLANSQNIYSLLSKYLPKHTIENVARVKNEAGDHTQKEPGKEIVKNEQDEIIENELVDALTKHSSALLDRPYLEKKGRNDFLVMKPDVQDPFVTVIPNAIYYNIEKKCVNWLDDCSIQGIRGGLLNRVESPY